MLKLLLLVNMSRADCISWSGMSQQL